MSEDNLNASMPTTFPLQKQVTTVRKPISVEKQHKVMYCYMEPTLLKLATIEAEVHHAAQKFLEKHGFSQCNVELLMVS